MQPRDKLIPWYFVLFFVGLALVDGIMVTLAVRTHTGTVTDHPYERGLAYNRVIEAEEKQEALGWNGTIGYVGGQLHFTLRDQKGNAIIPETVKATITRPTQAGMDFTVEMKDGQTPVAFPAKGLWEVRVDAVYNQLHYQQSKRIVVE